MALNRNITYSISHQCEDKIKKFITSWLHWEGLQRSMKVSIHINIQDEYDQILNELSMIENHFYDVWDARKSEQSATREDWRQFAVSKILKLLDAIYRMHNDNTVLDEKLNDDSESDKKITQYDICTPKIAQIRMLYANMIWIEWSNERHWGPRVGVILVLIIEPGEEKVLLVSYIEKNIFNYGFPKGKPNRGETIRAGGFRELKEEIGVDDLNYHLHIDEDDGRIIRKYPHIGPINRRQNRTLYYILTSTSVQFTEFRPESKEVRDVELHSIYSIPCCDGCQIRRKYIFINGSELPINYHMVTLRDINNENPTILEILAYIDVQNGNTEARNKYFHLHKNCGHDLN